MAPALTKARRTRRILLLVHADLVPPDDLATLTAEQKADMETEIDVVRGLRTAGHEVRVLGLYDELLPLRRTVEEFQPHVVFNLLEEFHSQPAYDHNVVSHLELLKVPYTGCNPRGLMIARDKALSKKILHFHRIRVPKFAVFRQGTKARTPRGMTYPLIVKSLTEDASLGISQASVVRSPDKLAERVAFVHGNLGTPAIVEEYIDGRELYVGVIGTSRLEILPVWELRLSGLPEDAAKIATRRAKWNRKYQDAHDVVLGACEGLPDGAEELIRKTTKRIYRALELSGYARIDYRLHADGRLYFIEANPNPDCSADGELASAAKRAGIDYAELLDRLVRLGERALSG